MEIEEEGRGRSLQPKIRIPKSKIAAALLTGVLAAGCGGGNKTQPKSPGSSTPRAALTAGYTSLDAQQYNDAIAKADEFLAAQPHGPGSAEALYLKGRALEGKNAAGVTAAEAKANLQSAREAYIKALEQSPKQPLEAYIRASLGNVAYFQDDYATAAGQLTRAAEQLPADAATLRAWAAYRVGLSQQRMGQFTQADKSFQAVQTEFPGTVPAQRAKERVGARAFYVQLATFASAGPADQAILDLKRQGVAATRDADPQGHALLRVGPLASYAQAQYLKTRFAETYPDAVVIP